MLVQLACLTLQCVVLGGFQSSFEVEATIKKIDAENRALVSFAGGRERTVRVAGDAKFLDEAGKPIADGLKAKAFKEGVTVTVTVEREANEQVIKAVRLGGRARAAERRLSAKESVGLKPLTDMSAEDRYKGEDGGLYGGGRNEPPKMHRAVAARESAKIVPRDAEGNASRDGKIVLASISMSNATQEFSVFKQMADADPEKSPLLTIVDCAQGGQAMAEWAESKAPPWTEAERRLATARVSPQQVQVAWIKLANKGPRGELSEHARRLERDTVAVLKNAEARFPNLRIAYLSSRIYGGYAATPLNPEPYAYESAFAVRWVIQDQIQGDESLNYAESKGDVRAPLVLWGPYLWADGTKGRKHDDLTWQPEDLAGDGTHPSASGRAKVARLLLEFFKSDELAKAWFKRESR